MHDLARPVRLVVRVRMIGAAADEREVAPVGILAAKTVTAAGERHRPWRSRAASRSRHRLVQRIDRGPVGDVENDTHHRRLRAAMQAENVVIGASAAKILRIVALLDRRQTPYGFVEARRLFKICCDKFDAAQAAHQALRHFHSPLCHPSLP